MDGENSTPNMEVGVLQGSALSSYLFLILIDALMEKIQKDAPEPVMFADDDCAACRKTLRDEVMHD